MHRNQYLIRSNPEVIDAPLLTRKVFQGLSVYHHSSLGVITRRQESVSLLLLGYIVDSWHPSASDSDILDSLAQGGPSKELLFRRLQSLSGRFVLLYSSPEDLLAVGDPCGARQIFYSLRGENVLLTSSVQMFWELCDREPEIAPEKQELLVSEEYERTERAWFGCESLDDRLDKVLPNHYLDLKCRQARRIPVDEGQLVGEKDACEFAAAVVKGSMEAIRNRFEIIHPLTAGWDSRTSLAACKTVHSDIDFFVFVLEDHDVNSSDVFVPLRLSGKLGLQFKVIRPARVRENFLQICRKEHIEPQPARLAEIQYLYNQYADRNVARVAGHATDIMKSSFYGHTRKQVTSDMLYAFTGYYRKSRYVQNQVENWLDGAGQFCLENGIKVLDLFYWEQRIGNWGALYAFEQDIATEEYWPCGHRNLLLSALRIDPRKRARPECRFYRKIVTCLWPEALAEACNPLSLLGRLNWRMRNNSRIRYYKCRLWQKLGYATF